MKKLLAILAFSLAGLGMVDVALAQDAAASAPAMAEAASAAAEAAPAAAAPAAEAASAPEVVPTVNKGDVAWMLTSTMLVILMTIPGLALF